MKDIAKDFCGPFLVTVEIGLIVYMASYLIEAGKLRAKEDFWNLK